MIFITGGTGYIGKRLIPELIKRNFEVHALVRERSASTLPAGCKAVIGDALDRTTFSGKIIPCKTFIQLVGVPHPSPGKNKLFKKIDLVSVRESVQAAKDAGVEHFIYISVAQGGRVMKAFQEVRAYGEELIRKSGMNATIIRPWYVIGPGHYWPLLFLPVYKVLELFPSTNKMIQLYGLVYLNQLIAALIKAVEQPPSGILIHAVQDIKKNILLMQFIKS